MVGREEAAAKRKERAVARADRIARSPAARRQAEIEEAEARRRAEERALAASLKVYL